MKNFRGSLTKAQMKRLNLLALDIGLVSDSRWKEAYGDDGVYSAFWIKPVPDNVEKVWKQQLMPKGSREEFLSYLTSRAVAVPRQWRVDLELHYTNVKGVLQDPHLIDMRAEEPMLLNDFIGVYTEHRKELLDRLGPNDKQVAFVWIATPKDRISKEKWDRA